jgi:hypothetical protein
MAMKRTGTVLVVARRVFYAAVCSAGLVFFNWQILYLQGWKGIADGVRDRSWGLASALLIFPVAALGIGSAAIVLNRAAGWRAWKWATAAAFASNVIPGTLLVVLLSDGISARAIPFVWLQMFWALSILSPATAILAAVVSDRRDRERLTRHG